MMGIGYMIIARWVGHKNGEVLTIKIYRHLNYENKKKQTKRLKFI